MKTEVLKTFREPSFQNFQKFQNFKKTEKTYNRKRPRKWRFHPLQRLHASLMFPTSGLQSDFEIKSRQKVIDVRSFHIYNELSTDMTYGSRGPDMNIHLIVVQT